MIIVAIDPGYGSRSGGCAVAIFAGDQLIRASFERYETVRPGVLAVGATLVVWEEPQCDGRSHAIAPTLIKLATAGATLAGMFAGASHERCEIRAVQPRTWKGNVAKPVQHKRLWARLSADERTLLGGDDTAAEIERACERGAACRWRAGNHYAAGFRTHNLLDAVALGVYATALGRML